MDSTQNLISREAVVKLRELIKACPTCLFGTDLPSIPFHVCPMHVVEVDDDGCLWFFSGLDSEHAANIREDSRVHLLFGNPSHDEFLTVYGEAAILRDFDKIDELWKSALKTWFPQGKDDPNLSLIRVEPAKAHYWDTRDGKLVSLAKILIGSVTGKVEDVGVHGDLEP